MILWYDDAMILWYYDTMILWYYKTIGWRGDELMGREFMSWCEVMSVIWHALGQRPGELFSPKPLPNPSKTCPKPTQDLPETSSKDGMIVVVTIIAIAGVLMVVLGLLVVVLVVLGVVVVVIEIAASRYCYYDSSSRDGIEFATVVYVEDLWFSLLI